MINVPQITADLARMPDRSLQQYAQMHRNDPYIVALALAESNRRKQLRIGAQAGQAQQMPTVVEQDIAQMAPEQVGIGSLPEQSLAKMAGGGIVAFEEGGEVEHYQNRGFTGLEEPDARFLFPNIGPQPTVSTADEDNPRIPNWVRRLPDDSPLKAAWLREFQNEPVKKLINANGLLAMQPTQSQQALGSRFASPPTGPGSKPSSGSQAPMADVLRGQGSASGVNALTNNLIAASQETDAGMYPRGNEPRAPETPAGVAAAAPSPAFAALQAAATQQGGGGAPRSGVGSLVQSPEQYQAMYNKLRPNPATISDPFAVQAAEAGRARIAASEASRDQLKQDIEALGEFGKEREARLKAREEKLGKQEGETTGLALLKAGFAMMSGTSPHAFVNIGAGAGIGVDEYTKGKEKIDAARERLDEAYSRLDEIRRGEKVANARELRAANKEVKLAEADVKDKGVAALRTQLGIEEAKATELVNAYTQDRRTQFTAESQERIAAQNRQSQALSTLAQIEAHKEIAAMPGAEQKLYTALGGGDILKGFEKAKTIMQETKKDLMTEYTEWLKANPMAGMEPDNGMNKFLKQKMMFSGLGGLNKPPAPTGAPTGQVRQ
jgi:hypothetical protein